MPGAMQWINKIMGPAETAGAIGATIADPALAGATIPMAMQGLSQMQQPGGVLAQNTANPPPTPNFPSFSAAQTAPGGGGGFFSGVPSSAATGIVPSAPTYASSGGGGAGSPDLINQAIAMANPATSPNPFAPWTVAA